LGTKRIALRRRCGRPNQSFRRTSMRRLHICANFASIADASYRNRSSLQAHAFQRTRSSRVVGIASRAIESSKGQEYQLSGRWAAVCHRNVDEVHDALYECCARATRTVDGIGLPRRKATATGSDDTGVVYSASPSPPARDSQS
jgi:hypothetical protein